MIVLYLVSEIFNMEREDSLSIYGFFTAGLIFTEILGAVLGDLVFGNKIAAITGGVLQALGAFIFCIPSLVGVYIGFSLIILGSGLFTPNIISSVGKNYLQKPKLLDSGFMFFYFIVNLSTFLGIFLLGFISEKYGYYIGFSLAGTLSLLSIFPLIINKKERINFDFFKKITLSEKALKILITLFTVIVFWAIYSLMGFSIHEIHVKLSTLESLNLETSQFSSLTLGISLPLFILFALAYCFIYNSQLMKLLIGAIFGVLAFGVILFIPENVEQHHFILFMTYILFLAISEIHIAPVILSVLTKFGNPKYLAILVSLCLVVTRLGTNLIYLLVPLVDDHRNFATIVSIVSMSFVAIILVVFMILNKSIFPQNEN